MRAQRLFRDTGAYANDRTASPQQETRVAASGAAALGRDDRTDALSTIRDERPLVSVVVPAYNAERWIDATLRSLRSQTYRTLEIIVVDDGSTDATADIVARHSARDDRVSLISQANAGVADARNCGIAVARGRYIAPTDADDLSDPTRIAKLVAVLEAAGPGTAVAYSWSSFIDEDGYRIGAPLQPDFEGDVRSALYVCNFVANGSAAMMRAEALRAIGGYDPALRARNAQGCEDWAVLLALAERWHFVRVPECLLGYRQSPTNMSSDRHQMWRSMDLVGARHRSLYPGSRLALEKTRKEALAGALDFAVQSRNHADVARLAMRMALRSPLWTYKILRYYVRQLREPLHPELASHHIAANNAQTGLFPIGDPDRG